MRKKCHGARERISKALAVATYRSRGTVPLAALAALGTSLALGRSRGRRGYRGRAWVDEGDTINALALARFQGTLRAFALRFSRQSRASNLLLSHDGVVVSDGKEHREKGESIGKGTHYVVAKGEVVVDA